MSLPDAIGRYRVLSLLGAGGMGQVYLAEDPSLGRQVALKVVAPEAARHVERLLQEARLASAVSHPNIAQIFEIGEADGRPFIAMEYVEGEPLSERIRRRTMTQGDAIEIGRQLFDALDAAHARHIVHRDLKPANLIVTPRGLLKVLDFGLATTLTTGDAGAGPTRVTTDPGLVLGTIQYMSPEQALGRPVDARSDIFSAGVVLFELITGRLPFAAATTTETLDRIVHGEPEAISRLNYGASPELERIIRKALEKEPARRYQHARDALVDLENLKRDSGTGSSASRRRPAMPRRGRAIDSVAVLPLATAASDETLDYLADGLTESLINTLSQLPRLRVMARSTVFRFKERPVDPLALGSELGVRAVLTGRLQRLGPALVIRAELVDTADGSQLWGGTFKRTVEDALALEEEVASEIAEQLRPRLSSAERKRIARRHTVSSQAFDLYLRGCYHVARRTQEDFAKGAVLFEQAIAADPGYALAYAGLADCWTLASATAYGDPSPDMIIRARAAAERATALDPNLAEAQAAVGLVRFRIEWNWTEAEGALDRALQLNPGYAPAHQRRALLLCALGRHDEALAAIRRAHELDPLSLIIGSAVGRILHFQRRYDEAIQQCRRTLDMDRHFLPAHFDLAMAYAQVGRYDESLAEFEACLALGDTRSVFLAVYAHAAAAAGETIRSEGLVAQLRQRYGRGETSSYDLGLALTGLGHHEEGLDWLERAFEARAGLLVFLGVEPMFDAVRSHPRFVRLLERLGLSAP
jgi:eukaryotic-like serine/threonine-protein kinase